MFRQNHPNYQEGGGQASSLPPRRPPGPSVASVSVVQEHWSPDSRERLPAHLGYGPCVRPTYPQPAPTTTEPSDSAGSSSGSRWVPTLARSNSRSAEPSSRVPRGFVASEREGSGRPSSSGKHSL